MVGGSNPPGVTHFMYTLYILRTNKNTLYTGITNNIQTRLLKHRNKKGSKYLKMFESFKLVYTEELENKSDALKREAEIKKLTKSQKEKLIAHYTF